MSRVLEEGGRRVWPCVSFLLVRENSLLLETRRLDKSSDPGAIAIPGGHMEPGETEADTLARELDEELGVAALQSWHLCSLYHPTPSELQRIHYYVVPAWQGEITAAEADSVAFYPLDAQLPIEIAADCVAVEEYRRLVGVLS